MKDECESCHTDIEQAHPAAPEQLANDAGAKSSRYLSVYSVPKMDCPSEEKLIGMAFESLDPPAFFEFDIAQRKVSIFHSGDVNDVDKRMNSVGLGASHVCTTAVESSVEESAQIAALAKDEAESKILRWLLIINALMFAIEITTGWLAQSTGLIADSLDMLADAAVYGVALYVVGRSLKLKLRAAHISGWLQLLLAIGVLSEVVRRFIFGSEPVSTLMMGIGLLALVANVSCLLLLAKSRNDGAHMKASWIFSTNDVIANTGVIAAGALVAWTGSSLPDLIIGLAIGLVVLHGARRILLLK